MRYLIVFSTLIYAAFAPAATLAERLAELNNDGDVLEAIIVSDAAPISGFNALWTAEIRYAATAGDVVKDNRVRLVGIGHGGGGEAWYWIQGVPDVLTNDPPSYFSGHNSGPFTASQIEGFCNTKWAGVETSPAAIKQFSLEVIDGLTVQASGLFHVPSDATNKWQQRSFVMRYTSAGQTPSTVLFERVETN